MLGVTKLIAHKMVIKSNQFLQKTFVNFYKPQFETAQKIIKYDISTLNLAFPVTSPL